MYAIYGNIYHPYTPNVSIYTIHGSYGYIGGYMFNTHWVIGALRNFLDCHLYPVHRQLSATILVVPKGEDKQSL